MKYDVIIGIDPDVDRSGVAYLDTHTLDIKAVSLDFPNLIDYLVYAHGALSAQNRKLVVVVEASWQVVKSNYHAHYGRAGEAIARKVGANHQVGKLIIEMCQHKNIECEEMYPLKKMWRGKDGKITDSELKQFCKLSKSRTNQEERDACLIAWCWGNFPISMR